MREIKTVKYIILLIVSIIILSCGRYYINKDGKKIEIPKRIQPYFFLIGADGETYRIDENSWRLMFTIENETTGQIKYSKGQKYETQFWDEFKGLTYNSDPRIYIEEPGKYKIICKLQPEFRANWNPAVLFVTFDEYLKTDGFENEFGEKNSLHPNFYLTEGNIGWSAESSNNNPNVLSNIGNIQNSSVNLILKYNRKVVKTEKLIIYYMGKGNRHDITLPVPITHKGKDLLEDDFPNYFFKYEIGATSGEFTYKSSENKYVIKSNHLIYTLDDSKSLLNTIGIIYAEDHLDKP